MTYKLIAFTNNANNEDIEFVNKLLSVVESPNIEIFNTPYHRIEDHVTSNMVVITFGTGLHSVAKSYIEEKKLSNVKLYKFPIPKHLIKKEKNKIIRQECFEFLKEIKEHMSINLFIPTNITINDNDLPNLNARQLLLLEKITEEEDQESCFQVNKEGKLIEISKEPLEDSKADIHLTFKEIYTIRSIMDVLDVKEVQIVSDSQKTIT